MTPGKAGAGSFYRLSGELAAKVGSYITADATAKVTDTSRRTIQRWFVNHQSLLPVSFNRSFHFRLPYQPWSVAASRRKSKLGEM